MRFQPDQPLVELWDRYNLTEEQKWEETRKYEETMNRAYQEFIQQTIQQFALEPPCEDKTIATELFSLFDRLDVNEETRKEFECDGDALMLKAKMEQKIEILAAIAESREARMMEKKRELESILAETGEPMPNSVQLIFEKKMIDAQSMQTMDRALEAAVAKRQQILEAFETKKHVYWQLCDDTEIPSSRRQSFIDDHTECSPANIQAYDAQIKSLEQKKRENSEQIHKQEADLVQRLKAELHIPRDEKHTLIELKRLHIQMKPCVQLINQREQLLVDSETQPKLGKTVLPHVERRLLIALTRYRAQYGRDLMWDGEKYMDRLSHIHLDPCDAPAGGRKTSLLTISIPKPTTVSTLFGNAAKTPRRSMENDFSVNNM